MARCYLPAASAESGYVILPQPVKIMDACISGRAEDVPIEHPLQVKEEGSIPKVMCLRYVGTVGAFKRQ